MQPRRGSPGRVAGGPSVSSFLFRKLNESFDNPTITGSIDVDFDLTG